MTAGLPGTGVGGMFYVLSALATPLWEAGRLARGRRGGPPSPRGRGRGRGGRGRVVVEQVGLAVGILAALWVTGWLLGVVLHIAPPHLAVAHALPRGSVLRTAALVLSAGTLGAVLSGVELLRWLMLRRLRRRIARVVFILAVLGAMAPRAAAQSSEPVATDAAIAVYEQWLAAHPADAAAWRKLARVLLRAGRPGDAAAALEHAQALAPEDATARRLAVVRAAAAPAITPLVGGSRDSDGNATWRLGAAAELAASGAARLGVALSREEVGDGITTTGLATGAIQASWQPAALLKLEGTGGATRVDGQDGTGATIIATGRLRARWRPAAGPAIDFRSQRSVLDASPQLVANRVVRTEAGATVELPVAGVLKLRGIGRTAALGDSAELNHRTTLAGVVALAAGSGVELSAGFHEVRYSHPSDAGYFAPRVAQLVEAGSYIEIETARSLLVALDLGVGLQRVALPGTATPLRPWRRALRLYALILVPLSAQGGRDLKLELDGEDSPIANEAATTSVWRYGSAAVSLRWAMP